MPPTPMRLSKNDQDLHQTSTRFQIASGIAVERLPQYCFVSDQLLTSRTLSGTIQVCFPMQCTNLMIASIALHVWVTQGLTNNVRGIALNNYGQGSGANQIPWRVGFFDPQYFHDLDSPVALSSVNYLAGDRIVVEVGMTVYGASAGDSVTITYGTKDSGGAVMDDGVAGTAFVTGASWIEFSDPLLSDIPEDVTAPCCETPAGPTTGEDPVFSTQPWIALCAGGGDVPSASNPPEGEIYL